ISESPVVHPGVADPVRFRATFTVTRRIGEIVVHVPHVILSPHFDDAVLSCWQLLDGPTEVRVVNVFTAAPPAGTAPPWWDRVTGATDPVVRMRERREEDAAALAITGTPSVELDLLDDQYRHADLSEHELVEQIGRASCRERRDIEEDGGGR